MRGRANRHKDRSECQGTYTMVLWWLKSGKLICDIMVAVRCDGLVTGALRRAGSRDKLASGYLPVHGVGATARLRQLRGIR